MFQSTNYTDPRRVSLREALRHPVPEPGQLWTVCNFPPLTTLNPSMSFEKCLCTILEQFGFPPNCTGDIDFNIRLNGKFLELFHGPTMSFKDVGCRVAIRVYHLLFPGIPVLAATSGDTGGAVADACEKEGVRALILYPKDRISRVQEAQMVGRRGIASLAVDGDFDACQDLVKRALSTTPSRFLSCNSVSLARLLPQVAMYAWLSLRCPETSVTIPSGNMGNATSFLYARQMGCRLGRLRVATNANDAAARFFRKLDHVYTPKKTVPTVSSAMDVGAPSNIVRMFSLWRPGDDAVPVYDSARVSTVATQYNVCPHTAVGCIAAEGTGDVVVATASPLKFVQTTMAAVPCDARLLTPTRLLFTAYRTVLLVGMPGVGKSTIARMLGGGDLDNELDFSQPEDAFLNQEQARLAALCDRIDAGAEPRSIVATGGSVVYRGGAERIRTVDALVVWLDADVGMLGKRCGDLSARGVVGGSNLATLFKERAPLYRQCADIVIQTDNRDPGEVARIVSSYVNLHP